MLCLMVWVCKQIAHTKTELRSNLIKKNILAHIHKQQILERHKQQNSRTLLSTSKTWRKREARGLRQDKKTRLTSELGLESRHRTQDLTTSGHRRTGRQGKHK